MAPPRLLALAVPLFPLAARLRAEPALRDEALAVTEGNGSAARVVRGGTHHAEEQVETFRDGRVRYRVRVRGLEEIQRWLLGFGPEAFVVAPESLREAIGRTAAATAARYAGVGPEGCQ